MQLKRWIAAVALALGLVTVPLTAQGMRGGKGHGMAGFGSGRMLERAAVTLDLTEQQKEFARKLAADTRAQAKPLAEQMRANREEIQAAVKANNTGAIDNLTVRQGNLMAQMSALHAKAMAAFYAQLTPEQKAKAAALTRLSRAEGRSPAKARKAAPRL